MHYILDEDYEKLYTPWNWSKRFPDSKSLLKNFTNVSITSSNELINQTKNTHSISYGDSEKQKIDIYYPPDSIANKQQTVIVIIHGGAWQEGNKEMYAFMPKYLLEAGYTTVLIGYDLAPNITLQVIINEINNGIDHVCKYFPKAKGQMFSCKFYEIFKNIYFYRTPLVVASAFSYARTLSPQSGEKELWALVCTSFFFFFFLFFLILALGSIIFNKTLNYGSVLQC